MLRDVSIYFNPKLPSVPNMAYWAKFLISIQEGIPEKISYERRDYESVDDKSLLYRLHPKNLCG